MESILPIARVRRLILIAVTSILAATVYLGCAASAKMTPEQKAAMDAKEAARQDSIATFELNKNWSLGYEPYKNKEYERVPRYYWKVIELDRKNKFKQVYSQLGRAYFELGKVDSAQLVYEKGIETFSDDPFLHKSLGHIYENREMVPEAIAMFEKAVSLEEGNENDLFRLAQLYVKADRIDPDAIKAYEKLTKMASDNLEYRNTLSSLYSLSGNEEARVASMQESLTQDPNNTDILYEMANYYRRASNWAQAIEYLERVTALLPDDMTARRDLAETYKRNDQLPKAIAAFEEVLKKQPDNAEVLTEIADTYLDLGQLQRARTYGRRALSKNAAYGPAYIVIGRAYERSVDNCQADAKRTSANFYDKLAYEEAAKLYVKAKADPASRQRAQSLIDSLEPVRPKKGDYFMHKKKKLTDVACYKWIAR